MANNFWELDGIVLPRNPDSYNVQWDNANAQYEPQAGGNLIRLQASQLIGGAALQLTWMDADRRTLNTILQAFNPLSYGVIHKLLMGSIQPLQVANIFFDTPQKQMSKDVVDGRPGSGGTRNDLTLTCRIQDPWLRSANYIPYGSPSVANVAAAFGGSAGNGIDGIPVWNGQAWGPIAITGGTTTKTISNLGTAPWSPIIRITGPFTGFSLVQQYFDVDGTGAGTILVYTGPAVLDGNSLLFNTATRRMYTVTSGAYNEIYSFYIETVAFNTPFPYWPPMPPGNSNISFNVVGYGADTVADMSNSGTNQFAYW